MKKLSLKKGDSKPFFILSCISAAAFSAWNIAYVVCIFLRNSALTTAQANMALSGQTEYTVEVTSPFFAVLRVLAYILPVLLGVWTVLLHITDRKGKELPDSKLIFASFGANVLAAVVCALDIAAVHMIF